MASVPAFGYVVTLPEGFRVGHWSDHEGVTGCTVVLGPAGTVSAGEVRGGGPGTHEFELLSPATATPGAHAFVMSGGSAFGLATTHGVVSWLAERGEGYATPAGHIPLVSGAIVYDLMLGDASARPGSDAGYAACEAASTTFERGNIGAGTGCTAGKLGGPERWTKTGLGAATIMVGEATLTAIAVVNPFGDVLNADGSILAGIRAEADDWLPTREAMLGAKPPWPVGEATVLVCLITDAKLTKTEAWQISRSASAGVARAVSPTATSVDGDLVACLSSGAVPTDLFLFSALAAEVTSEAIRDGARQAV